MMRSLTIMRCNPLSSPRFLLPRKKISVTAAALLAGRHFSAYRFNSLVEWIEDEDGGKSLLATPIHTTLHSNGFFRDPRSRLDSSFRYERLPFQGEERKKMLEEVAIEWIGGALNSLNDKNGKAEAYAIVGGSGTGKTRFLGEMVEQWDRLQALSVETAKADLKKASREIPPDTLVFPIGFSYFTPLKDVEIDIIDHLSEANPTHKEHYKRAIGVLATTRCLYACYDIKSFSGLVSKILVSLDNKTLNPKALKFEYFLSGIWEKYYAGSAVPVVILIDEISKIGNDYINHFIPAMNRMMDNQLVIVWSTLAEGPFERAESNESQRYINKRFLPALSPADTLAVLIYKKDNISKLKTITESLYLCWNNPSERVLVDWNDVLVMLSEAAGGLPRGVETLDRNIEKLDLASLTNESMPLMKLLSGVSDSISATYSSMDDVRQNSMHLAVFKESLARNEMLNLNPSLLFPQNAAEAICGGCLIDAREYANPSDDISDIQPIIPAIFKPTLTIMKNSLGKKSFNPKAMETFIVTWLELWFAARRACVFGTADKNKKPILERLDLTTGEQWRPFHSFLDVMNQNGISILSTLDNKCVLEKYSCHSFPTYSSNNPGIYQPAEDNYEGLDAIVVIPSTSGRLEDSVLIAVEAKNSLLESANRNVYKRLPSQYQRTAERMSKAGWTPGINAFFYVMSKGQLDSDNARKRLLETCPHMRVLAGEELKAAMGPTIYWGFKHLRVLGAVYQKNQAQTPQ